MGGRSGEGRDGGREGEAKGGSDDIDDAWCKGGVKDRDEGKFFVGDLRGRKELKVMMVEMEVGGMVAVAKAEVSFVKMSGAVEWRGVLNWT